MDPTIARLKRAVRREEQRAAAQRGAAAQRRAAAMQEAVDDLGGQKPVAEGLKISVPAVSKALREAKERAVLDRPVGYLELDLPRHACDAMTAAEADEVPEAEWRERASRAANAERARAWVLQRLAEQCRESAGILARLHSNLEDGLPTHENDDPDPAGELKARWGRLPLDDSGFREAAIDLMADLGEGLLAEAMPAWCWADEWQNGAELGRVWGGES